MPLHYNAPSIHLGTANFLQWQKKAEESAGTVAAQSVAAGPKGGSRANKAWSSEKLLGEKS